jgi:acyl-CoA reductase-like NAD-dependent aldehyde dehydrogenase
MSNEVQSTANDARARVSEAREAARSWAALPVADRARKLAAAGTALLQKADDLAQIVQRETHKPLAEAYSADVLNVADLFAYWCDQGPALLRARPARIPKLEMPGKRGEVHRLPRGVVAIIAPWNFPVAIPMRGIVPALLAGNGVVLKPSEFTPESGAWLVEQLRAELGPIIAVMPGAGEAGAALIDAKPDLVLFTGSTATGRKVAIACAERDIPVDCELGGKDCAVVLADAALDRAANGIAWGILNNAGQNCASIERVAVHSSIAEPFIAKLVERMGIAAPDVKQLVTKQQQAIVVAQLADAQARGGEFLCGAPPADADALIGPTLLTGLDRDATAWREESFGPVAVLEVHDSDEALIEAANDTPFGLGASIWSADPDRAMQLADGLNCGMVWVNNHAFTGALPDLPWVGTGASGGGVTNSPDALLHMTRPRVVLVDRSKDPEPWWYPYGETMVPLMQAVVRKQRDGGLGALFATLGALKKRMAELKGK